MCYNRRADVFLVHTGFSVTSILFSHGSVMKMLPWVIFDRQVGWLEEVSQLVPEVSVVTLLQRRSTSNLTFLWIDFSTGPGVASLSDIVEWAFRQKSRNGFTKRTNIVLDEHDLKFPSILFVPGWLRCRYIKPGPYSIFALGEGVWY